MNMKRVLIIAALALVSIQLSAQGFEQFLKQIWFQTEFGYSAPVAPGMKGGMMARIALEWRQENQEGLFAGVNLDTGYDGYQDKLPAATNLTDGDVDFNDLSVGAGWRMKLSDSFCLALSLYGGVTFCNYQSIVASTYMPTDEEKAAGLSVPHYAYDRISAAVPSVKLTSFYEFYVDPSCCIFLTAGYVQHLSKTPFAASFGEDGIFEMSVGFTTTLF